MDQVKLELSITREADGSYTGRLGGKTFEGREFLTTAPGFDSAESAGRRALHLLALHDMHCGLPATASAPDTTRP